MISVQGESALHTACWHGLTRLTRALLDAGANPNSLTTQPLSNDSAVYSQTPLHLAITKKHEPVVKVMLQFKGQRSNIFHFS